MDTLTLVLILVSITFFGLELYFKNKSKSLSKVFEVFVLISVFFLGLEFKVLLASEVYFFISFSVFFVLVFEDLVKGGGMSYFLKIIGLTCLFLLGNSQPDDMFKLILCLLLVRAPIINITWNLYNDYPIWFLGTTDYFFDVPMRWIIKKTRSPQGELMVFIYGLFLICGFIGLLSVYFNI